MHHIRQRKELTYAVRIKSKVKKTNGADISIEAKTGRRIDRSDSVRSRLP